MSDSIIQTGRLLDPESVSSGGGLVLITDATVISNITNDSNWSSGVYSGSTSGLEEWNYYAGSSYVYIYDGTTLVRTNREDIQGIPDAAIDDTLDAVKTTEQVPVNTFHTDAELLVSEQDLTSSYADFGSEIDMEGYNRLGLYIDLDVNDSTDIYFKILGLDEIGGTEYDLYDIDAKKLTETDGSYYYEFDVDTVRYVQVQAYAGTVGATAGDLTVSFNKRYLKGDVIETKQSGVYAYLSTSTATTITTANTFQYIEGTFTNPVLEGFELTATPSIKCTSLITQTYEIDWHATVKGDSVGIQVEVGIGVNGGQPTSASIMGTFLKTAGEDQAFSGTTVLELGYGDEVQLMITSDGAGDVITVDYFSTTIRPFCRR